MSRDTLYIHVAQAHQLLTAGEPAEAAAILTAVLAQLTAEDIAAAHQQSAAEARAAELDQLYGVDVPF